MPTIRYRGDTKPILVTLINKGLPINLTGCTGFVLTVDPSLDPTDASTKLFALSGTVLSPTAGTVEFLPTSPDVDRVGTVYFDVQFVDARGFINTAGKDSMIFLQDITK